MSFGQAVNRVLAVPFLRAEALRLDDELAFLVHAATGQGHEAGADVLRERARMNHVEPQLNCGRDLVDVLPLVRRRGRR